MSSSLHQWESDPLFSAAEVVQDSADRMESIFRLLIHEQSLLHGDHANPRLLRSIEHHRRDLATILETTRWQLEDFERAVNGSALKDERHREDVIVRHEQFISAIKEHVINVENNLQDPSYRDSLRNFERVSLDEKDRNGLALFLSGGNTIEQSKPNGADDSILLRRFLDSASTNGRPSNDSEIIESKCGESISRIFEVKDSLRDISSEDHNGDGSWDVEANEGKARTFFQKSQQRRHYNRGKFFQLLNNIRAAFGFRITRNYTKRLKDGEEQRDSSSQANAPPFASHLRIFTNAMPLVGPLRATTNTHQTTSIVTAVLSLIIVIGFLLSRITRDH